MINKPDTLSNSFMPKYLLILLGLCCFHSANAQLIWKSKGQLYKDKYITVEIEYAMGDNPCGTRVTPSEFRYRITHIKQHGEYYINWRLDYFNCDHELKSYPKNIHITKDSRPGIFRPENNQFSAFRLVNNFNAVKKSLALPPIADYIPVSVISLEPKTIKGKLTIVKGEPTTLTLVGGYLAANTNWRWYEGDCNRQSIGSGTSISVQPRQTTVYALKGDGDHPTPCISVTVNVSNTSMAAEGIDGPSQICEGEKNIHLAVNGGNLGDNAKWVWYQNNCDSTPIGEGNTIDVSPLKTCTYYVRAESPKGNTFYRVHELKVITNSQTPDRIDGIEKVDYGQSFTLTIHGGKLAADANWVWYSGLPDNKIRVATGDSFYVATASDDRTYYVRAEGICNNSGFVVKNVRVINKQKPDAIPLATHPTKFFINGGIVSNDPNHLNNVKNYVGTIGGGKNIGWFIRAKFSSDQAKATYETMGTQITNYSLPGYYQYNGQVVSKRTGYTGGIYLGVENIAVYTGGGYGTRDFLYGVDQYGYNNPFSSGSAWVKNTAYSYSGAEIEGGLILKVSFFNMMGGVSTIEGKYTDYNLGIGFNF